MSDAATIIASGSGDVFTSVFPGEVADNHTHSVALRQGDGGFVSFGANVVMPSKLKHETKPPSLCLVIFAAALRLRAKGQKRY